MLLHHKFIECAKKYPQKVAIHEQMTGSDTTIANY